MDETQIFKALADPTRRAIFERLADEQLNASEIRQGFEISQPAVSQHISVLRNAGLIEEERQGRSVYYSVAADGLAPLHEWLQRYRVFWPQRVDALKKLLGEMDQ
ncbi:ArsR/SmtB family transcription factor [Aestuariispira ectoiniformans]|uniref:ArsR/SmtB family transcription factor n=1 Tax=Aestuariispira ectoiniformans TaxID=2775080 RepID=UPI00223B2708|nr:metalloregulator ArsR/SmtB family transcription factor [Aestuariispira ectoiniformans]